MRLVFAGTPAVAVPTLHALAARHDIAAVITRPDAPLGRKRVLTPSPVAAAAEALGLPILKTARLDEEATARVTALDADLGVIVAYGGIVREPLLSAPRHGWINLHFSLLPAWRGAAPVQRALIAGDAELGVSVFQLVPVLDAGDVFAMQPVEIPSDATADTALALLAEAGADATDDVVSGIADGTATATAQQGTVTLAPKLTFEDGALDWTRPVVTVFARYRGVTPEPGAHTSIDGTRLKILAAAPSADAPALAPGEVTGTRTAVLIGCGDGALEVTRVQPAGKGPMNAADWWRGLRTDESVRAGS
jgi:methionyl-tRNA formyltransferase